jgi:hypothetical protein
MLLYIIIVNRIIAVLIQTQRYSFAHKQHFKNILQLKLHLIVCNKYILCYTISPSLVLISLYCAYSYIDHIANRMLR